ncbi:MAG: penicillin-binding protein 1C [Bacteroidales bacterium]|nr:penicillin-binding protein 1C [Bacteroidales bacterium]
MISETLKKPKLKHWIVIILVFISGLYFYFSIPSQFSNINYSTVVFDKDGYLLNAHIANDGQWRFPPSDSIPHKYEKALLLFEDEYFYYHPGINPLSLFRAAWQNISAQKIISGGSTISMQTIRLSNQAKRTIWNKFIEAIKAIRLETRYSKKEILNLYASHAPFGGNVVGLEAASWRYFGRPSHSLSWGEAATLAVLPNAPGLIHTKRNRELLQKKRNRLLLKMLQKNFIDSTNYNMSTIEPIVEHPSPLPSLAPHLMNYYFKKNTNNRKTSLQINYQEKATKIVNRFSRRYAQNHIYNASAIIIDNKTNKVLVYIGNSSHNDIEDYGENVDVIQAPRSTGSILKPFLYASCLQDGLILPTCLIPDIPTYYSDFSPQNYTKSYDGAVSANDALSRSLNVPFVKLLNEYGIDRFINQLRNMGITTINHNKDYYGLSLILGGAEANLWDLASVYSSMARTLSNYTLTNGKYMKDDWQLPTIIQSTDTTKSSVLFEEPFVLDASVIWYTVLAMEGVHRPEEETGWEMYQDSRRIAWKTGTSFGHRDAWAIGITPEYTVATWVGNASGEGRPGLTGGTTASPIMFELFRMLPQTSWFKKPFDAMIPAKICKKSGFLASENCEETDSMLIPNVGYHNVTCPFHKLIHLDKNGIYQVNSDCYETKKMQHKSWFVLPPVMEWFYKQKHPFYIPLPPYKKGCHANTSSPMQMIYPTRNTKIMIPKNMQGESEKVVLKLSHRNPSAHIYWHLNEQYAGETFRFHQLELFLTPGSHKLTIIDDQGNKLEKNITCLNKEKNNKF